jgi:hypothetical protein
MTSSDDPGRIVPNDTSDGRAPGRVPREVPEMTLPRLVAALLCLGGCQMMFGGHMETCGEYPPGGGPAVIATKDQQVCDVVRLRVGREIDLHGLVSRADVDRLLERTIYWENRATLDDLVDMVRKDAGDAVAAELRRAVDSVLAHSTLPMPADCPDVQRCLVKGAARGLRIALSYAHPRDMQPPPPSPAPDAAK